MDVMKDPYIVAIRRKNNTCSIVSIIISILSLPIVILLRCTIPMIIGILIMGLAMTTITISSIKLIRVAKKCEYGSDKLVSAAFVTASCFLILSGLIFLLDCFAILDAAPMLTTMTEEATATVIDINTSNSADYLVLEYEDSNSVTQRATLRLRGRSLYCSGDLINIKYNPAKPNSAYSAHVSFSMPLSALMLSERDPQIINLNKGEIL